MAKFQRQSLSLLHIIGSHHEDAMIAARAKQSVLGAQRTSVQTTFSRCANDAHTFDQPRRPRTDR